MTEPRMRARQKGQQFPYADLEACLVAHGDDIPPLPETIKVLDEIVTDFIIETCHEASLCAQIAHRAKIKVDDFKFALRRDPKKLGRVLELQAIEREVRKTKKMFSTDEGDVKKSNNLVRGADDDGMALDDDRAADAAGPAGDGTATGKAGKGKKRGRKKRKIDPEPQQQPPTPSAASVGRGFTEDPDDMA